MLAKFSIRQVLFPTDFSEASAVAGRAAADLARQLGARLHVLHVVPPVTDPTPAPKALRAVVEELGPGLSVAEAASPEAAEAATHCIVCAGPSPDLICEPCRTRIRGEALERKLKDERVDGSALGESGLVREAAA